MGSLQAQRAIQTRWWHHSQVLQGQSISGLSSERLIMNRLGFNKNSLNPACGGREEVSNDGAGVELGYGFGGSWGLFPQSIPR